MKPTCIITFGRPGCGKGTLGKEGFVPYFGATILGTGEYFREEEKKNSLFWRSISEFVRIGDLVPDEQTLQALRISFYRLHYEQRPMNMLVLDGVPRSEEQAHEAVELVREGGYEAVYVVEVDTPEPICRERLKKRATEEQRLDDDLNVSDHRLALYEVYAPGVRDALRGLTDGYYRYAVKDMREGGWALRIPHELATIMGEPVLQRRTLPLRRMERQALLIEAA